MTPLEQLRDEIADMVFKALDNRYPRYRLLNDKDIAWEVESAALVGVVRWAMVCGQNSQVQAAKRSGINRNTVRKILRDSAMMAEIKRFDMAERYMVDKTKSEWPLVG